VAQPLPAKSSSFEVPVRQRFLGYMFQQIELGMVDDRRGLEPGKIAEQGDLHEIKRPKVFRAKVFYAFSAGAEVLRFPPAFEGFPHFVCETKHEVAQVLLDVGMIAQVMNGLVKALEIIVIAVDSNPGIVGS
jgi:hypothetical protein